MIDMPELTDARLTLDDAGVATLILARDDVAYIHARSAYNNCFQCRIERA